MIRMPWNPFRGDERPRRKVTPEQEGERLYAEQCAQEAGKAGFSLDFAFEVKPEEEALVKELRSIEVNTFWADNSFDGKVEEKDMSPEDRERYQGYMARKAEIARQKEQLLAYLQPYTASAEVWRSGAVSQRTLDRALNYWTTKYGDAHRQRFFAAVSILGM